MGGAICMRFRLRRDVKAQYATGEILNKATTSGNTDKAISVKRENRA